MFAHDVCDLRKCSSTCPNTKVGFPWRFGWVSKHSDEFGIIFIVAVSLITYSNPFLIHFTTGECDSKVFPPKKLICESNSIETRRTMRWNCAVVTYDDEHCLPRGRRSFRVLRSTGKPEGEETRVGIFNHHHHFSSLCSSERDSQQEEQSWNESWALLTGATARKVLWMKTFPTFPRFLFSHGLPRASRHQLFSLRFVLSHRY